MLDLWLQPVTPATTQWATEHRDVLDDDETLRWKRYHRRESQDLFLVAHVATRFVLSRYGPTPPEGWAFGRSEHGRPYLLDASTDLRFNISHTDGMAVVLIHGEHDAGVDVESPWRSTDIARVSRRVFTADERAALLELPKDQQASRFYQLWTLKESFIKAKGKGFAMPLSAFGFALGHDDGSIDFSCDPTLDPDPSMWAFSTIWTETGHVVSVGAHVPGPGRPEPTVRSLDP